MKISHGQIDGLLKAYAQQTQKTKAGAAVQPAETRSLGVDKLALSDRMREIQMVREAVLRTPDVRGERVKEISKAVADGKYEVKSEDIAEKMLGRVIADKLGK